MDVAQLFQGVAVIIDDQIDNPKANIHEILKQLDTRDIPYKTYQSLPSDNAVSNFRNLSFLLLDWRLMGDKLPSGVAIPAGLSEGQDAENILFLKKLLNVCFCPVFIFSNEGRDDIVLKLEAAGIYYRDKPSHIFIKSKSDLYGEKELFGELGKWVSENPSIYVLKTWEKEYQQSARQLFSDFQKLSPVWPKIMWKTFGDDGTNKSLELGELISRNLFTRMTPFEFSDEVLNANDEELDPVDIKHVLEGERYLKKEKLNEDVSTGDLFKEDYNEVIEGVEVPKVRYFLNIRAQCDLVRGHNVDLYCIKGRVLKIEKDTTTFQDGQYIEKVSQAIVPFIDGGLIIEFFFKDLIIKKWNAMKGLRIGRVLPPYITRIQQRYSLYSQRQGLPRIPNNL